MLFIKLQLHVIGKVLNYKLHQITLKIVINYINYKLQLAITPSLAFTKLIVNFFLVRARYKQFYLVSVTYNK